LLRFVEHRVHARLAHVRVDEQDTPSSLSEADGQVRGDERLAFAGPGARDREATDAFNG
jgi:hypothetical protein